MEDQNSLFAKYTISGMDCPSCVNKLETFCNKINGVKEANINFSTATLSVLVSPNKNAIETLEKGIENLGYGLKKHQNENIQYPNEKTNCHYNHTNECCNSNNLNHEHKKDTPHHEQHHSHSNEKMNWLPIFALTAAFFISIGIEFFSKNIGFIAFTLITSIGLLPILKKSWQFMKVGYFFSVETLMGISALGALFIGASEEAAAVIILLMIGEGLEGYTTKKAQSGIQSLASLLPDHASSIAQDGSTKIIKSSEIKMGDHIEIKAGERFPIDGIIRKGTSSIDESLLTGESLPIFKTIGDKVVAGSINTDGNLLVEASLPGTNNAVIRLIKMVEEAQGSKTRIMRSIEKFSRVYTPIILLLGTLVAVIPPLFLSQPWTEWIYRGLTILLIGCPCALVISTPSAIAAAITAATKMGILIKNATAMEAIGKVTRIAFDKTGTITDGKLSVTDIIPIKFSDNEILKIAASIEAKSTHPIAQAISNEAKQKNLSLDNVTDAKHLSGKGVSGVLNQKETVICSPIYAQELNYLNELQMQKIKELQLQGKTIAVVIQDKVAQGFIALADQLKTDAKESLKKLKQLGIKSVILTGDNKLSAHAIAGNIPAEIKAELLPEQKLNYIQEISKSEKIAMVGDGINDAPAIAAAEIGIAMGDGTNVAIDTAQIVISRNNVSAIVDTILLSRKTMNNVKQNITIAIGLKAIFLALTVFGETQLWMAILADTGATVIVTLNALRLLNVKPQDYSLSQKT